MIKQDIHSRKMFMHFCDVCAKECTGRAYTVQNVYIRSARLRVPRGTDNECNIGACLQKLCGFSCSNKVTLLWVPVHFGIQVNDSADTLVRERLSSPTFVLNQQFQFNCVLVDSTFSGCRRGTPFEGLWINCLGAYWPWVGNRVGNW